MIVLKFIFNCFRSEIKHSHRQTQHQADALPTHIDTELCTENISQGKEYTSRNIKIKNNTETNSHKIIQNLFQDNHESSLYFMKALLFYTICRDHTRGVATRRLH